LPAQNVDFSITSEPGSTELPALLLLAAAVGCTLPCVSLAPFVLTAAGFMLPTPREAAIADDLSSPPDAPILADSVAAFAVAAVAGATFAAGVRIGRQKAHEQLA